MRKDHEIIVQVFNLSRIWVSIGVTAWALASLGEMWPDGRVRHVRLWVIVRGAKLRRHEGGCRRGPVNPRVEAGMGLLRIHRLPKRKRICGRVLDTRVGKGGLAGRVLDLGLAVRKRREEERGGGSCCPGNLL